MIWVVAGTKSARELIVKLLDEGYKVLATTTTSYGKELIGQDERLTTLSGALNSNDMAEMITRYGVKLVIDATHPYSVEVKANACAASEKCGIPYIRFEREPVPVPGAVEFDTYMDAARYLENKEGNVLLAIGSKNAGYFRENANRKVYARVLPVAGSVSACTETGFKPGRIIAMQFTFSETFEAALNRELGIKYLVTKESGTEGGLNEKISAAIRCGTEVIVIRRPLTGSGEVFFNPEEIIRRAGEVLNG